VSAFGALAPSFALLTATQTVGRPLALSLDMVIAVVIAEEMPKGSRAYGLGLAALANGFGAGNCVIALKLADLGPSAWRILYVLPLVYLLAVPAVARQLPESKRYVAPHAEQARVREHQSRFWLLAISGLLLNLLIAPASGFQNQFLKHRRGFSAGRISLFTVLTQTPAGVGVLAGSVLADTRGRRHVTSVAIAVGSVATVMQFFTAGWSMWMWSFVGAIIGAAAIPAISAYQTELFPTGVRARAKAGVVVVTLVGSSIGLLITGWALDAGTSYGWLMAALCVGPLLVAILVIVAYPETAAQELEALNPEDNAVRQQPAAP
jgi:MFS family permease